MRVDVLFFFVEQSVSSLMKIHFPHSYIPI